MKKRGWKYLIAAAVLCGGLLADSNLRLVTTEYDLRCPGLPPAFEGFRVVQLSDLHGAVYGEGNSRLLQRVRESKPDLIALTGDLADRDTNLRDIDSLLGELTQIAPVYYVSGNHEWTDRLIAPLTALFRTYGVRYLRNESVVLEREGASIVLAGVEDPNGYRDQPTPEEVAEALPEGFILLLGHRNYWVEKYPDLPVDLILCGHAHGGVIRLPVLGGILDHHGHFFPGYEAGLYASGRYQMVVSRGLGSTGGVPRLFNNPEIVVITLHT